MRHANSPRRPRRLFSPRRFRHTARITSAVHPRHALLPCPGPSPSPPRLTGGRRANRDSLTFAKTARVGAFRSREDTAYLAADRISGDLTAVSGTAGGHRQCLIRTFS